MNGLIVKINDKNGLIFVAISKKPFFKRLFNIGNAKALNHEEEITIINIFRVMHDIKIISVIKKGNATIFVLKDVTVFRIISKLNNNLIKEFDKNDDWFNFIDWDNLYNDYVDYFNLEAVDKNND